MVELTVEQARLLNGADLDLLLNPLGAGAGDRALGEERDELQSVLADCEGLRMAAVGVNGADEARLAEEEVQVFDLVEGAVEGVLGVDGEVGRDEGERGAGADLLAQKAADGDTGAVVADA